MAACMDHLSQPLSRFLTSRLRRDPNAGLLAAQLVGVVLIPLMDGSPSGQMVVAVFGVLVLGMVVRVVRGSPAATNVAIGLAMLVIGLSVWNSLSPSVGVTVAISLSEAAFYFYGATALIRYMLVDDRASRDELYAAAATFTVVAWAFAHLFAACQALAPNSFGAHHNPHAARSWTELLFLSFSTLSGVGLGDIIPLRPMARALVMLEEFSGVMYIALVVSRLVGLLTLRRRAQGEQGAQSGEGR